MAAPHPQAGSPEPEPAVLALQSSKLRPEVRDAALSIWHSTRAAMEGAPPEQLYPAYLAALRAQKRGGPARAVAAALAQAFPAALWPKVELAALLHRSGDHQRALEIGQAITAAFPDAPDGPRVVLQALVALGRREAAENLLATLPPALQEQEWVLQARLQTARRSGHAHAEADAQAAIAARLRQIAPSNPLGHSWAIAAARDAGQLDQAETLAQAAIQASPDSADVWRQAALVAQARKQEELAYQRWETLRTRFPKSPAGFIGAVELSLALQQPAVTESLLGPALEKFPNNRDLLTAAARLAVRGRKWAEAAVRWQEVIDRSPDDPAVALAAAMSFIGPQAGRQKRLPAVLRRLEAIHERFPDFVPAYAAHINALREAKRSEEAEALGAQWAARFPADPTLAIARARIAEDLGRPADALAWLEAARAAGKPTPPLEAATIRALSLAGRPSRPAARRWKNSPTASRS
jgi:tetratricopeptide (TPR) repeat protein